VVYQGLGGDWYWHLVHRNGKVVADGSEGYKRKSACVKSLTNIIKGIETAGFQIEGD
jgi:uncharacterized protein YegP (UPF0339 family)